MIVQDTSASTDNSGALVAGSAVKALLPTLAKGTQVALVAAGSDVLLAQRFTTDTALIEKAMAGLSPAGDGALWEGVARAANELKSQPNMVGTIVLITDGNNGKGTTFSTAKGLAIDAGATVFGVGVSGKIGNEPQELASATGGTFTVTDKAADISGLVAGYAPKMNGLYAFTYKTTESPRVSTISLCPSATPATKGSYIVGSDARGATALAFQPPVTASGVKGLQNDFGKYLAIVLGLLGAALAAYAIIGIAVKDQSGLASVLQPYSEGYVARSREATTTTRTTPTRAWPKPRSCSERSSSPDSSPSGRASSPESKARSSGPTSRCGPLRRCSSTPPPRWWWHCSPP